MKDAFKALAEKAEQAEEEHQEKQNLKAKLGEYYTEFFSKDDEAKLSKKDFVNVYSKFLAHDHLHPEQDAQEIFDLLDVEGNESVCAEELAAARTCLGVDRLGILEEQHKDKAEAEKWLELENQMQREWMKLTKPQRVGALNNVLLKHCRAEIGARRLQRAFRRKRGLIYLDGKSVKKRSSRNLGD